MIYLNQDSPPGVRMKADPTSAAIGALKPGSSIEDVQATLIEGGVPADRIHFLSGEDGIAFLDDLGSWFTRLVSVTWHDAKEALASGKVLVGVFGVDKIDASRIRLVLGNAGVDRIRSFGTWTWTG